jgi:formamidopyrimidine-DNA glycosylase
VPEGPEVETIRRGLDLWLVGQKLAHVDVLWHKSFLATEADIIRNVEGAVVEQISRRAKVLMIKLSTGFTLLCHLKMTGQMVVVKCDGERFAGGHPSLSMRDALPDSSTRVVFWLESGDRLYFNDQRKFGWIKLVLSCDVELDPLIARLGPEVLSPEFNIGRLRAGLIAHGRAPIKAVILDQSTAAGIGNIYADESLHLARIHPARLAGSLSPSEVKRLHTALRDIMTAGIEHGGTSFAHFVNSLGGKGDYLEHARVFRRQGQLCDVCGTLIEKIRVAGRGTHICPTCQKLPIR